jgi:hypothetical protein
VGGGANAQERDTQVAVLKTYQLLLLVGGLVFVLFGVLSFNVSEDWNWATWLMLLGWLIWGVGCVLYWRRDK